MPGRWTAKWNHLLGETLLYPRSCVAFYKNGYLTTKEILPISTQIEGKNTWALHHVCRPLFQMLSDVDISAYGCSVWAGGGCDSKNCQCFHCKTDFFIDLKLSHKTSTLRDTHPYSPRPLNKTLKLHACLGDLLLDIIIASLTVCEKNFIYMKRTEESVNYIKD